MFATYVVVTLMAIAANTCAATADFMRFNFVLITAAKVGVPESWLPMLGTLKAAGALGLLVSLIGVPLIGVAAAVGLVLFFVGAIITHLRARREALSYAYPGTLLLLAVGSLTPRLASW